jgi:hypothetical protein
MSNDLVKRLREDFGFSLDVTAMEAADRIEALEAALRDLMRWTEALAICGTPTDKAWKMLNEISDNARALMEEKQ